MPINHTDGTGSMTITGARKASTTDHGFTLIELLVVVLIIGILSAIAIPLYVGQADSAREAQVKADLGHAVTVAETFAIKQGGSYSSLTMDALEDNGFVGTEGVTIAVTNVSDSGFTLRATHGQVEGTTTWTFDGSTGTIVKSD